MLSTVNNIYIYFIDYIFLTSLLGAIFAFIPIKKINAFLSIFIVLCSWELYEGITKIDEPLIHFLIALPIGSLFFSMFYRIIVKKRSKLINFKFTNHQNWFDMWTPIHLLIWAVIAYVLSFINAINMETFSLAVFIILAWEVYEAIIKIGESIYNSLGDIIVGILGFISVYLINNYFNNNLNKGIFINILIILIFLTVWGKSTKGHDNFLTRRENN
jgi:hypothetical protein